MLDVCFLELGEDTPSLQSCMNAIGTSWKAARLTLTL